jgi:hypothetical protein
MKTKIYSFDEWLQLYLDGEAYEDMLINGKMLLLALECRQPKCRAKVWAYPDADSKIKKKLKLQKFEELTWCKVCSDISKRPLGKIRAK